MVAAVEEWRVYITGRPKANPLALLPLISLTVAYPNEVSSPYVTAVEHPRRIVRRQTL